MIKGIAVKVLNFICGKRQLVIEFIDGFVLLRRFTKYRLMVENLSQEESFPLALDKKGQFGDFADKVKDKFTDIKDNIKDNTSYIKDRLRNVTEKVKECGRNIKSKFNEFENKIAKYNVRKFFLTAIDKVKNHVKSFIDRLKNFFLGLLSKRVIECAKSMKVVAGEIFAIARGIYFKITSFQLALTFREPGILI